MRRWAPHLTAMAAALVLAPATGYLGHAMLRRAAATFRVFYWPLDLAQLLLLALLGFLLAAPVWWPRTGWPPARRPDWAVLALYAVPGLLLAHVRWIHFIPLHQLVPSRWMPYVTGDTTRTVAGLLIGYGLGLALTPPNPQRAASPDRPS